MKSNRYLTGLAIFWIGVIVIVYFRILGCILVLVGTLFFYPEFKMFIQWIGNKINKSKFSYPLVNESEHPYPLVTAEKSKLLEKLDNLVHEIELFKSSKNWKTEEGFQGELQGYLKNKFSTSRVEVQTGASRPDIVIDNIAIEVKGPTDDNAINSLPAKCIKYTKHYDFLIIVLFRPSYSQRNYDEIMSDIKQHYPNVKVVIK